MKKLLVSPAPHIHGKERTDKLMRDVIIALSPSLVVSIYFFGLSAFKLMLAAVAAAVLLEYLIGKYLMKTKVSVNDYSAVVTGLLLALNLPPSAPWWIAVIGSAVAIGIAKMTFGGLGQNLFNPALVGRVFLLVSFPVIMTD
ncbi:MAG: RnfABCDGE type electron transport complex subunit D, partial [Bacteroidales bacterium]|nr:RnfABCDGE type electron transport complex subunit D [Bacteroidales bacterium]